MGWQATCSICRKFDTRGGEMLFLDAYVHPVYPTVIRPKKTCGVDTNRDDPPCVGTSFVKQKLRFNKSKTKKPSSAKQAGRSTLSAALIGPTSERLGSSRQLSENHTRHQAFLFPYKAPRAQAMSGQTFAGLFALAAPVCSTPPLHAKMAE